MIARAVPVGRGSANCRIPWVVADELAPTPAGWTPGLLTGLAAAGHLGRALVPDQGRHRG